MRLLTRTCCWLQRARDSRAAWRASRVVKQQGQKRNTPTKKSSSFTSAMFGNSSKHSFCAPWDLQISTKVDIGAYHTAWYQQALLSKNLCPLTTYQKQRNLLSPGLSDTSPSVETKPLEERPRVASCRAPPPPALAGHEHLSVYGSLCEYFSFQSRKEHPTHISFPLPWNTW